MTQRSRRRFRGEIAGFGTTSGTRIVIGRWWESPYGGFADVMVERADGHRLLLAPDDRIATLVTRTYQFDEVILTDVDVRRSPDDHDIVCEAGPLTATLRLGGRTPLGWLLRGVPNAVAEAPAWSAITDPIARVALRGVRTRGTAGQDRREWFGATDRRAIVDVTATWDGADLGTIASVWPPVRFGFSSTPRRPGLVSTTTTIEAADW